MRQSLSDLDKPAKLGQWGKTNRPPPELKYEVVATDGLVQSLLRPAPFESGWKDIITKSSEEMYLPQHIRTHPAQGNDMRLEHFRFFCKHFPTRCFPIKFLPLHGSQHRLKVRQR